MDILPPSFTDIGHPLVYCWGMMQLSLTHFCALVFPLLTVGASLSVLGLGCCRLGTFTFLCPQKFPLSRWWASSPMYVKRMWRFCGWLISCNHFSTFRYGASSYISMGMLAFLGSSSIWCLSIFTSALLTRGIPMYFKGGWMLTNRLHPKMLCLLPHALRSMASS